MGRRGAARRAPLGEPRPPAKSRRREPAWAASTDLDPAGGAPLLRAERLAPDTVLATLEGWARFNYVRGLDGIGAASPEGLDIELLRQLPDRRWLPAATGHAVRLPAWRPPGIATTQRDIGKACSWRFSCWRPGLR